MVSASAAIESKQHLDHLRELGLLSRKRGRHENEYRLSSAPTHGAIRLHLVRHGQGFHNLLGDEYRKNGVQFSCVGDDLSDSNPYRRPELRDPPLTATGRAQAKSLQGTSRTLSPAVVITSPMSRAVSTALLAFPHLIGVVPFIAHEDAREQAGVHVCDQRNPTSDIRLDFPALDVSLIEKDDDDPLWHDTEREAPAAVCARARRLLDWIAQRGDSEVVIVSHSAFLFMLLNVVVETVEDIPGGEGPRSWFETGEMRTVHVQVVRPRP